MSSRLLEARYKNLSPSKIALNEKDAREMGLEVGEICIISDENGLQLGGGKAVFDAELSPSQFAMEADSAKMMGIETGFEYVIEQCTSLPDKHLRKIVLEVMEVGDDGVQGLSLLRQEGQLARFLDDRVVHIGMRLRWRDYGYDLLVKDTDPKLSPGQYTVFGDSVEIELKSSVSPFHGVLLVDTSVSMLEKDICVQSLDKSQLTSLYLLAERIGGELKWFISRIERGETVDRFESAMIGCLLFVAEKMERGLGEKVVLIGYGEDARFIGPSNATDADPFFRATNSGLINNINGQEVKFLGRIVPQEPTAGGNATNMEMALDLAARSIKKLRDTEAAEGGPSKPISIILLTDGAYTVGHSPAVVIKEKIIPLEQVALHTVAMGSGTNEQLMERCAELGGGTFTIVKTLEDIIQVFSTNAKSFNLVGTAGKSFSRGALAQTKRLDACPKCGQEDFVRGMENRDGKFIQVVTCSVCGHKEEKISL